VRPVQRFHWDSAEYAEAFATLVRCAGKRVYERQILRELFAAYPAESHAVDWGAGGGDLTSLMVEHFQHVYAVEPHPGMRAVLATRCPRAQLLDGTIMSTVLPTKVEVGLISHVFYHVPDHKAALDNLRRKGVLPRLKNDRSIC
jgi:trans-aconitate methyltransferase